MDFRTNKIDQKLPDKIGENAKRLEEFLQAVRWQKIARAAIYAHIAFLIFLFTTIAVIRLAFKLF